MSTQGNKPTGIKIGIRIFVNQVSGERLWEIDKPIPSQIHIAVNVNVLGIEKRSDVTIDAPFVFTVTSSTSCTSNIKCFDGRGNSYIKNYRRATTATYVRSSSTQCATKTRW
jgi:hypothetical protein